MSRLRTSAARRTGGTRTGIAALATLCVIAVAAAGCTPAAPAPGASSTPAPTTPAPDPDARTALPADPTTVVTGADPAALAVATSRILFKRSPAVVLVAAADPPALTRASATAATLGVPLLLTPTGGAGGDADAMLRAEIARLAPATLVTADDQAATWAQGAYQGGDRAEVVQITDAPPAVVPDPPLIDLLVLTLDQASAAAATARAAGARLLAVPSGDPRTDGATITALAGQASARVLALGESFGPAARLRQRIDTAATGVQLPGGGQVVFPGRRMVALYGHPGSNVLGALGEQSVGAAVSRARRVAGEYSDLVKEPVVPAFEIIATVASSSAGADGDYSAEASVAKLKPWVDAAESAGIYVMLDLQPGRTDFLTQAKRYTELLQRPHVGLALDPEWRLKPNERHMVQIGSVTAAEVNQTAAWLAELTRANHLPQKVLMVHQFRLDMITSRETLKADYDELRVVIHVDGFGGSSQKLATWRAINANAPAGVFWGWKNFYDEDKPTFTPAKTVAITPAPVFVSYQ